MHRPLSTGRFVLCLDVGDYPASLERWKVYRVLPDSSAARHRQLRVVDETGEDYLFPKALFRSVRLSPSVARLHGGRAVRSKK